MLEFTIPTTIDPSALAWCSFATAAILAVYAFTGKNLSLPDWLGKVALPDLDRRGRAGVAVAATAFALAGGILYYQVQRGNDIAAFRQEVGQATSGKSASDLGEAYSMLFDDAGNNSGKRCYLEAVISARLAATADDPPVIPDNVRGEIKRELARGRGDLCYAYLASDLTNAVKLRKQREFATVAAIGKDRIDNRDTPDLTYAEDALAYLAPSPTPSGWIYLGKTLRDGTLADPPLDSGSNLPLAGQTARVDRKLLIEASQPNLNQDAPDVAGVYDQPSSVRIVKVVLEKQYAYALVDFVSANDTVASEKQ
jgi:hypothetical protein